MAWQAAGLVSALLVLPSAHAQAVQAMRQEVLDHLKSRFSFDGRQLGAEMPELTQHMAARWGQPNRSGTAETPRLVWILRVPGDPLGNCVRFDALKFNKNNPGLEAKVLTGKCATYEREKLSINDPVR
jgi:hypothetical protein